MRCPFFSCAAIDEEISESVIECVGYELVFTLREAETHACEFEIHILYDIMLILWSLAAIPVAKRDNASHLFREDERLTGKRIVALLHSMTETL
jgi:hypothetical protein